MHSTSFLVIGNTQTLNILKFPVEIWNGAPFLAIGRTKTLDITNFQWKLRTVDFFWWSEAQKHWTFTILSVHLLIIYWFRVRVRVRVRVRKSVIIVTAASQDWGLGFGPVTVGRERASCGYRPQTLNPNPGERAMVFIIFSVIFIIFLLILKDFMDL